MVSSDAPKDHPSPVASSAPPAEPADSKLIAKGMTKAPNPSTKDEDLSAAELKKRRKAEKQARREQGKQDKQAIGTGTAGEKLPGGQSKKGEAGKTVDVHITHNERGVKSHVQGLKEERRPNIKQSGSGIPDFPKSLPVRGATKRTESVSVTPTSESKEVALFGHLYGQPKRTSVTGAGRDIHPAVLALGLQMSSYVICGSNARCIATLFCFKRVCTVTSVGRAFTHTNLNRRS